ncbi:MAG: sterol desaturase family protein [Myxococcota bacterium]|nr:sterol desaturase family protein [Myxococcota bacterium]
MDVLNLLMDTLDSALTYVISPSKRLFVGYLVTALVLAWCIFRRLGSHTSFWAYIFDTQIWFGASARGDYKLIAFNLLFKAILLGQFLMLGFTLADQTSDTLAAVFGPSAIKLNATTTLAAYTFAITVIGDLSVYWIHRACHQIPALWAFHQIHHSAETLTPFTQLRIHPVELLINNFRSLIVFGLLTGGFAYVSAHPIRPVEFLGVNIFTFLFFTCGANLRHSHVPLTYGRRLEHLFISPRQHQIHHSIAPEHHHANYGSKLAVWDWLWGTLIISQAGERLRFGCPGLMRVHTLTTLLFAPFVRRSPPPENGT